jgi:hypothetical protein
VDNAASTSFEDVEVLGSCPIKVCETTGDQKFEGEAFSELATRVEVGGFRGWL